MRCREMMHAGRLARIILLEREGKPNADFLHVEGAAERMLDRKGRAMARIERFHAELRKAFQYEIKLRARCE